MKRKILFSKTLPLALAVILLLNLGVHAQAPAACPDGQLVTTSSQGKCEKILRFVEGCITYASPTKCETCEHNYLNQNGDCVFTLSNKDPCAEYKSKGVCAKCQPGMYVQDNICRQMRIAGCLVKDKDHCLNCAEGFEREDFKCYFIEQEQITVYVDNNHTHVISQETTPKIIQTTTNFNSTYNNARSVVKVVTKKTTIREYGIASDLGELVYSSTKAKPNAGDFLINSSVSWRPLTANQSEFIGLKFKDPLRFERLEVQGGANDEYVTEFWMEYSKDHQNFKRLQRIFKSQDASKDTLVVDFEPIEAVEVRLHPIKYNKWPSMRFELFYTDDTCGNKEDENVEIHSIDIEPTKQVVPVQRFDTVSVELEERNGDGKLQNTKTTVATLANRKRYVKISEEESYEQVLESASKEGTWTYASKPSAFKIDSEGYAFWRAGSKSSNEFFGVRMKRFVLFQDIQIMAYEKGSYLRRFRLEYSVDGNTFIKMQNEFTCDLNTTDAKKVCTVEFPLVKAVELRLYPLDFAGDVPSGAFAFFYEKYDEKAYQQFNYKRELAHKMAIAKKQAEEQKRLEKLAREAERLQKQKQAEEERLRQLEEQRKREAEEALKKQAQEQEEFRKRKDLEEKQLLEKLRKQKEEEDRLRMQEQMKKKEAEAAEAKIRKLKEQEEQIKAKQAEEEERIKAMSEKIALLKKTPAGEKKPSDPSFESEFARVQAEFEAQKKKFGTNMDNLLTDAKSEEVRLTKVRKDLVKIGQQEKDAGKKIAGLKAQMADSVSDLDKVSDMNPKFISSEVFSPEHTRYQIGSVKGWRAKKNAPGAFAGIGLGDQVDYYGVQLAAGDGGNLETFSIEFSNDGVTWTPLIIDGTSDFDASETQTGQVITYVFPHQRARFARVVAQSWKTAVAFKFDFFVKNARPQLVANEDTEGRNREILKSLTPASSNPKARLYCSAPFSPEFTEFSINGTKGWKSKTASPKVYTGVELDNLVMFRGLQIAPSEPGSYITEFEIQFSNNSAKGFSSTVYSCGGIITSNGGIRSYVFEPVVARFARIVIRSFKGWPALKFEFYYQNMALPGSDIAQDENLMQLGRLTPASRTGRLVSQGLLGTETTDWPHFATKYYRLGSTKGNYIGYEMPSPVEFSALTIAASDQTGYVTSFEIQVSNDSTSYKRWGEPYDISARKGRFHVIFFAPVVARNIRIVVLSWVNFVSFRFEFYYSTPRIAVPGIKEPPKLPWSVSGVSPGSSGYLTITPSSTASCGSGDFAEGEQRPTLWINGKSIAPAQHCTGGCLDVPTVSRCKKCKGGK